MTTSFIVYVCVCACTMFWCGSNLNFGEGCFENFRICGGFNEMIYMELCLYKKNYKAFRLTIRDPIISEMEVPCYSYIWGEEKQPTGTLVSRHNKNELYVTYFHTTTS